MYIKVHTTFDGMHCWLNAPKQVDYLKDYHRHTFHVYVTVAVTHTDREIEFYMLKDEIDKFIKRDFDFDMGSLSCEEMAKRIGWFIKDKYNRYPHEVEVSEDNNNSAIIRAEDLMRRE